MSMSEVVTLTVLFHLRGFSYTVSYNRFTELMQAHLLLLTMYKNMPFG